MVKNQIFVPIYDSVNRCAHLYDTNFKRELILIESLFKRSMFSLQALHAEVQSLEPAHAELVSLGTSLCPTAPEERVRQLKDELETLQRRLHVQNEVLPQR